MFTPGAAGGCGWQLCPLGWLFRWLRSLTHGYFYAACLASWSHGRFYTLSAMAFSRVVFSSLPFCCEWERMSESVCLTSNLIDGRVSLFGWQLRLVGRLDIKLWSFYRLFLWIKSMFNYANAFGENQSESVLDPDMLSCSSSFQNAEIWFISSDNRNSVFNF